MHINAALMNIHILSLIFFFLLLGGRLIKNVYVKANGRASAAKCKCASEGRGERVRVGGTKRESMRGLGKSRHLLMRSKNER